MENEKRNGKKNQLNQGRLETHARRRAGRIGRGERGRRVSGGARVRPRLTEGESVCERRKARGGGRDERGSGRDAPESDRDGRKKGGRSGGRGVRSRDWSGARCRDGRGRDRRESYGRGRSGGGNARWRNVGGLDARGWVAHGRERCSLDGRVVQRSGHSGGGNVRTLDGRERRSRNARQWESRGRGRGDNRERRR